jgi:hypothetical protein
MQSRQKERHACLPKFSDDSHVVVWDLGAHLRCAPLLQAAADSYKASSTKGNMVSAARNLSVNGAALKPAYSSIL